MTESLYEEVQHFYGRQMRHLDEGEVTQWAATFTEDGVFAANARPHPQEGRGSIERGAHEAAARLAAAGVQHRHWLGMLEVAEQPDGTVLARTYALIIATPKGGAATVHLSTSCEDRLVRVAGELKVRHRQVCRDDLPAA
ncbi:nuclear transport factor 2 family protein [Kitasatospora sp. NPDC058397]|uniref:nuclear transport factor 2 family protein n=1 Tax=unclassified Kitasatospora TaxID=2633591 RepID=UPI003669556F